MNAKNTKNSIRDILAMFFSESQRIFSIFLSLLKVLIILKILAALIILKALNFIENNESFSASMENIMIAKSNEF